MKKKVIIDTNFLLIPIQLGIDIFSEIDKVMDSQYEFCVVEETINELKRIIKSSNGKDSHAASVGLQLIKQKSLNMLVNSVQGSADDNILDIADKSTIIATQDRELRMKLRKLNIPIIVLHNNKIRCFTEH